VEVKNAPIEAGFDPPETVASEVVSALAASTGPGRKGPVRVLVSSFWPVNLAAVRVAGPELATGLLVHPSFDAAEAARTAAELGCGALNPFHAQVTPALVDLVHGLGMSVLAWTVNEPADVASVATAGADAVISDRVTETLATLTSLGRR
jgi:glycerophosphoryl diester phosphodiesterase